MKRIHEPFALVVAALALVAVSGIGPNDRLTWVLEVAPVLLGASILAAMYRRFALSNLSYRLLFLHAVVLIVGGHYTYAEVPLGFWVQEVFDFSRNHYDRLGHFAQGLVPAIVAREILKRWSPLGRSRWLPFLVVCICLSISAFYELIEWWSALVFGESAAQFLGTQGDVWDTQWDMFLALVGALTGLLTLSKLHDRSVARLAQTVVSTEN